MVRTKSTTFQLQLIRQQKDKSRTERVNIPLSNTASHALFARAFNQELSRRRRIDVGVLVLSAGTRSPKESNETRPHVLRNSVFTSGEDIYQQTIVNAEVVDGLSAQMLSEKCDTLHEG
jgi:hypothetical protein